MNPIVLVDDFPGGSPTGGAEQVNKSLEDYLDFSWAKSVNVKWEKDKKYIISNISTMPKDSIKSLVNSDIEYVILEHDYKICETRHPWRHEGCIVPKDRRINYDLYKRAEAVFVQTTDHLNCFLDNEVEANFINLKCSLWGDDDLYMMEELLRRNVSKTHRFAIYDSSNWIKNTAGAVSFCKANVLDFDLIQNSYLRKDFLLEMYKRPALVFFPLARESCCRLVVEARCLNMNVITNRNYGAVLEPWFSMSGDELIKFLREQTNKNIEVMRSYLC